MPALRNDVRDSHLPAVQEGLALVGAFVDGKLDAASFEAAFGSFFDQHALDGHEDDEGPIPADVLASTLSLRLLRDVRDVVWRLFDDAAANDVAAYRAAGRITRGELHHEVLLAIARSALSLAVPA